MDMDYNYVRMRNALHNEDFEAAENYKRLYESGKEKRRALLGIDYVIIILLSVSVLLGVYILRSEQIRLETQTMVNEVER